MAEHPLNGGATTLSLSDSQGVQYGTYDTVATSACSLESVHTNPRTLDIIKHPPPTINSLSEAGSEPRNLPPNDEKLALRISKIPASVTQEQLARWINNLNIKDEGPSRGPKRQRMDNIHTLSLAPSPSSDYDRYQVATVNFRKLPSELDQMCRPPSTSLVIELGGEQSRFSALFDSHFEGLTPLNNPKNPTLDIIAVTGLAGHAFGSWRSPDGPEMWLRDFVPKDLEQSARILTYGYNSMLATESSKVRIGDLATSFLEALKDARSQKGTTQRPIIFIGHSLGGVVIKKALRKADCSSVDLKDVYADILRSCHGIMFFGVPNLTLEVASLREMVKGKPNNHLIEDLGGTSQFLETLGEEFGRYFKQRPTKIICFHELKNTSTVQFNWTKIKWERSGAPLRMVTAKSAIHPPALTGIGLDADHSSMVKYKSMLQKNYQLVRSELSELLAGVTLGPSLVLLNKSQRETILQWISMIEYKKHHATAKETILDKTGQWLLNKNEFRNWRSSKASSILWLHGIPGAGKTKLVSAVIDFLNSETTRHEPIVYFYCSRNDPSRRNSAILMQSMVKQLSLVYPHLPESVVEEYNRRREDDFAAGSLDFEESQDLLISLLSAFPQTTIVIDALDENDVEERLRLLGALQDILRRTSSTVRIFVASRDDQDIKLHLEHVPNLFIKAEDNRYDIERFIHREVENSINTKRLLRGEVTAELKKKIISVIVDGAKEMFQWANLQIKQLYPLSLEEDVWENLGRLPKTLEETYSQIIDQISSRTPREQECVKRALMWIMCAEAPLNRDLWAALSFYPNTVPRDGATLLLGLCNNLVTFDQELGRVVFAHLSVEEYLEKTDAFSYQHAYRMALEACLSDFNHEPDRIIKLANPKGDLPMIQLARYCIVHWPYHAERCYEYGIDNLQVDLLQRFLGTPKEPGECYLKWINLAKMIPQGLSWVTDLWYKHRRYWLSTPPNPIFLLPCFSFGTVLHTSWKSAILNINTQNDMGHTPLLVATFQGNESAMDFLLENGADVNAKRGFPAINSLMAAIISHKPTALLKLLDAGASIHANSCNYRTVLEAAAKEGDKDTVELLLSTIPNAEVGEDFLKAAAGNPDHGGEIMSTLLDKHPRITQEVLEIAAKNPNGRDIFMILAANYPHLTITEAVLSNSIRNFAGSHIFLTLLSEFRNIEITEAVFTAAASTYKSVEAIRILLNKYPNYIITDSTLRAASKQQFPRSWEVMQMLLSRSTKIAHDPETIFCGIVKNSYTSDNIHMLLILSPSFKLSRYITGIIENSNYCNEIREILLFHGFMKARSELLSAVAEGGRIHNTHDLSLPLLLLEPSQSSVSSLPVASVARLADEYLRVLEETHHGRDMMDSLLSTSHDPGLCRCIPEVTTKSKKSGETMRSLLERYPGMKITEAIIHTAVEGVCPKNEMKSLQSDYMFSHRLVPESALGAEVGRYFTQGDLKERASMHLDTEYYTIDGLSILMYRFVDLVITEDIMLETVQCGEYSTLILIERLLKQHSNTFKILADLSTEGLRLEPVLYLLLSQYPRAMISSSILIALVKKYLGNPTPFEFLLTQCPDAAINDSVLITAAGVSKTLFRRLLDRPNAAITELVLIEAVKKRWDDKMIRLLMERRPHIVSESVLDAAINSYSGTNIVDILLASWPEALATESVLAKLAGIQNGFQKINLLLAQFPDIIVTEAFLIMAVITVMDPDSLCRSLIFVLDRFPNIIITASVLNMVVDILVRGTYVGSAAVMSLLLDRNLHFAIDESALITAASRPIGPEILKPLVNRRPDMVVTEAVLVAAVANKDPEMLQLLLDTRPDVVVTEAVLIAAAGNWRSEVPVLQLLLDRYPDMVVTEAGLIAAAGNSRSGVPVLQLLLDRYPDLVVTEAVFVAALEYLDSKALQFLLDRYPDLVVTEAVLIAAAGNWRSEVPVLQLLLDRYPDLVVTEAVLIAAAGNSYYEVPVLQFLLDRYPDMAVTEAVLIAAAGNSWHEVPVLQLLLDRYPDLVVTEAVLIAAVGNSGCEVPVLQLLLDRYPDMAVTEAGLIAAAGNSRSGVPVLQILLDRYPDLVVTKLVLCKLVESRSYIKTKALERIMDKYPEPTIGEDPWTTPSDLVTRMKLLLARRYLTIETPSAKTCIPPH